MPAQAGLFLVWSETSEDTFCRVVAQVLLINVKLCAFTIEKRRLTLDGMVPCSQFVEGFRVGSVQISVSPF